MSVIGRSTSRDVVQRLESPIDVLRGQPTLLEVEEASKGSSQLLRGRFGPDLWL